MAYIAVKDENYQGFTLYLNGLSEGWTAADGIREVDWYIGRAGGGIPTTSSYTKKKTVKITESTTNIGVSEGGYWVVTGLEANTQYGVYCEVWYKDTCFAQEDGYAKTTVKPNWVLVTSSLGELDLTYSPTTDAYYSLDVGKLLRTEITFADSGIARVYTEGSTDTVGYFGTSPDYNENTGVPYSYDVYNDDYNDQNFYIECPVYPNTTYYVFVRPLSNKIPLETTVYAELLKKPVAEKWDWYSSNGSNASANVTLNSYYALNTDNPTSDFSHLVWNDMVDKVNDIIEATGGSWWSKYASYFDTKMHSEPYELTADKFNSLRYNIGARYSTGIDEVSPGDRVYADYFLTLTNCMNDWIDTL